MHPGETIDYRLKNFKLCMLILEFRENVQMCHLPTEMQKVADVADISVLFFSAGANF